MSRTVIREETSAPTPYADDQPAPGLALVVGVLLALAVVALAILFMRGTWNNETPSPGTGNTDGPVPTAPAQEPGVQVSVAP